MIEQSSLSSPVGRCHGLSESDVIEATVALEFPLKEKSFQPSRTHYRSLALVLSTKVSSDGTTSDALFLSVPSFTSIEGSCFSSYAVVEVFLLSLSTVTDVAPDQASQYCGVSSF